jgi:erythromycin esterase-like protein
MDLRALVRPDVGWLIATLAVWCQTVGGEITGSPPAMVLQRLHLLNFNAPYRRQDYAFLQSTVGGRSIVQLGESIHVTREFPHARLALMRFLHEEMGFDVIAFEGSGMDAWLAQDYLYRTKDSERDKVERAQRLAWFGLWQTPAMREILAYVAATEHTSRPLYLASFDIQPGTSSASGGSGAASLAAFFEAVQRYRPMQDTNPLVRWQRALAPCFHSWGVTRELPLEQQQMAAAAIAEIATWIEQAAPRVAERTTAMHAAALLRVPAGLRAGLSVRQVAGRAGAEAGGDLAAARRASMIAYQGARDGWNATNALALRAAVSRSHRILLWAHHSHVNHNSSKAPIPTMGQYLLAAAGETLYTIGLFAAEGEALYVNDAATPPVQRRKLRRASDYGIESSLEKLATSDFFLDLAAPGELPASWKRLGTSRIEADGERRFVLAKDFHAAVFIHSVHPGHLRGTPGIN